MIVGDRTSIHRKTCGLPFGRKDGNASADAIPDVMMRHLVADNRASVERHEAVFHQDSTAVFMTTEPLARSTRDVTAGERFLPGAFGIADIGCKARIAARGRVAARFGEIVNRRGIAVIQLEGHPGTHVDGAALVAGLDDSVAVQAKLGFADRDVPRAADRHVLG